MTSFGYAHTARIVRFGWGALDEVAAVLDELGCARALAVVTPSQRAAGDRFAGQAGTRLVHRIDDVRARVPGEAVDEAVALVPRVDADVLVAIGGGSAVGLAKGTAAATGLPIVAVPTTYSGSEMTAIYGVTRHGRKHGGRDPRVAPRAVVYDPALTVGLPAGLTASSGMNALAQAIGSLSAPEATPVSTTFAFAGIRGLVAALPRCVDEPDQPEARSEALLGAHLCGWALSMAGLSAHHDLAHALGDLTGLDHASVHAVLLPQTTQRAARREPAVAAVLTDVLGTAEPGPRLLDLLDELGIPRGLADLGLSGPAFERVRQSLPERLSPEWLADPGELDALLARTYRGSPPTAGSIDRHDPAPSRGSIA